jgi:hypothetical protein
MTFFGLCLTTAIQLKIRKLVQAVDGHTGPGFYPRARTSDEIGDRGSSASISSAFFLIAQARRGQPPQPF